MTTKERSEAATEKRTSSAGQWLIGLFVVLALVASLLMVFGNNFSIPATLAVIAALWAAVIGAVLVTKYRRQADVAETRSRDLRLVYELQLEREIAARRQYESDVEAAIRHEVAAERNVELEELKTQVLALRANLEMLLGTPLPDMRAAIGLERPRELGSGLSGAGFSPAADDRVTADRDFATTAPPADSGRHVPAEDVADVDPAEMTEIIPVVTDDPAALYGRTDAQSVSFEAGLHDVDYGQAENYGQTESYSQTESYGQPGDLRSGSHEAADEPGYAPHPVEDAHQEPGDAREASEDASGYSDPPTRAERVAYSAQAYEPPAAPQSGNRRAATEPEDIDGAHSAGRPASELLSRLRASSAGDTGRGGRRRRD